ncbi:PIH1 domain-containing protein 2 [Lampris incognitus]|uniref:PIH1 domain-containing protein 2 n=1 Tax=Lampris incognitus TaxID=2546036 RepID=UPI0024B4A5DF|nr:PIH1 domain-containing protein 2 [Lampris incognitus]
MSATGCPKGLLRQASALWSMMDELSQNDPGAYRKLIEKQMREGAEFSAPPRLVSGLRTEILEPRGGPLYINICSWKRVPAPLDGSQPVPVCGGPPATDEDESGEWFTVMDVALNPAVLQECKTDSREMDQVCLLAMSFAQQQHKLRLSQRYTVTGNRPKSSPEDVYRRLGFRQRPDPSATSVRQPDTVISQTPASLLQQISSLHVEESEVEPARRLIFESVGPPKENLIQVISSTPTAPRQTPEFNLRVKDEAAGVCRSVELTVELPKVSSTADCHLSISQDDVLLEVEDLYHLLLELPETVDEERASATFDKKKRRLTLTVACL